MGLFKVNHPVIEDVLAMLRDASTRPEEFRRLTRKLSVQGNMGLLMRNVPTVLDFVRCAQEVTEIPD